MVPPVKQLDHTPGHIGVLQCPPPACSGESSAGGAGAGAAESPCIIYNNGTVDLDYRFYVQLHVHMRMDYIFICNDILCLCTRKVDGPLPLRTLHLLDLGVELNLCVCIHISSD